MSLKHRLTRLERQQPTTKGLHPQFWEAVCGLFPVDQLDIESREKLESLYGDSSNEPDPVEALMASALAEQQSASVNPQASPDESME